MVRCYRPDWVHEVTMRTIDGRWWFEAHNDRIRKEIIGALAMAQRRTQVRVHAFTFMSNHYHGMFSADFPEQFSAFLQHFHAAIARIVNERWERAGKVWNGRAKVIPIAPDEESLLQRLDYLLGQNVKAGAGSHPLDWTGASSTPWLLNGTPLVGLHRDQTAITLASRNGRDPGDLAKFTEELTVEMSPLPCFEGRSEAEWRAQLIQIADEIAIRHGAMPGATGSADAEQVLQAIAEATVVPTGRFEGVPSALTENAERVRTSRTPERKAVKRVHAASREARERLEAELDAFEEAYCAAALQLRTESARLAAGQKARAVQFPQWSFPGRAGVWPRWPGLDQ